MNSGNNRGGVRMRRMVNICMLFMLSVLLLLPLVAAEDDAAIRILSPKDGDTVLTKVDVTFSQYGGDRVDLYLDGEYIDAIPNISQGTHTYRGLDLRGKGKHTIGVKLYDCAHAVYGQCIFLDQHFISVDARNLILRDYPTVVLKGEKYTITADVCRTDTVVLYVDGKEVDKDDSPSEGSCSIAHLGFSSDSPGEHTVEVSAKRCVGGVVFGHCIGWWTTEDSQQFTVFVDSPPIVSVRVPSGPKVGGDVNIFFSAGDSDPGDGVQRAELYVKGPGDSDYKKVSTKTYDPYVASVSTDRFTYRVTREGTYYFKVVVYDTHSTSAEDTAFVTVSASVHPPKIVSISAPDTVAPNESFTVSVRATDEDGDVRLIGISVGGYSDSKEVDGGDETAIFTVPGLPEGTYTLKAFARDNSNLEDTETKTIVVESPTPPTPPGVDVSVSLDPTTITVGDSTTVTASASADNGVSTIILYSNGHVIASKNCKLDTVYPEYCTLKTTYAPSSAGKYAIEAEAKDRYGYKSTDTVTLTVKELNTCKCTPHVSLDVSPTSVNVGDSVTVKTDGYVSYSGDCKYEPYALRIKVYVDGELVRNFDCGAPYAPECTKGPFTFDYTFTEPGDHTVKAQMVWDDCNGATRDDAWSSPVTVHVSGSITPSVTITASKTEVAPGESVTFTANARANQIKSVDIVVDGITKKSQSCGLDSTCTATYTTSFQSGEHRAYAVMRYVENGSVYSKQSSTVTVTVKEQKNEAPTVYKVDGYSTTYIDVPYTVTVCAKDSDGKVVKIEAWMDNREKRSVTVDSSDVCRKITLYAPLTVGQHTVYARAKDDDGAWSETNSTKFTAIKRNTRPSAKVIPSQTKVSPGATFTYKVCGTDRDGKIVQLAGKVDSDSWQYENPDSEGCAYFQYRAPNKEIDLTIYGKAKDDDGAWSDIATAIVHVRYSAPNVYVFVPAQVVVGSNVVVKVVAYDVDGDLAKAEMNVYDATGTLVAADSNTLSDKNATVYFHFTPPRSGTYRVVVRVSDSHGKATIKSATTKAVVINTPPVASVYVPNKVSPGRTFDFRVCGKDSDGRVIQLAAKVGAGDWQYKSPDSEGCAEFVTTAPSTPTRLTIYGKTKDDDGAWSKTVSATVEVNYSAPGIVRFDVPSRVYAGKEFNVVVSARDVDRDLDRVELVVKKGTTVIGSWVKRLPMDGGMAVFAVSVHEAGDYTATVTVYDAHGLSSSKSKGFSAVLPPNVPPVVDSVKVLGTVYVGEPFDINVCAHDPDGTVEWISYAIQGGSSGAQRVWKNGCHVIRVSSPGDDLGAGTYEMNVWAQDYRGAKSKPFRTTITVKERDTIPPRVRIEAIQDTNVPGEIYLRIRASDNVALEDANVYYRVHNTGDWILAGRYDLEGPEYAFVASVPARVPGDYNIMVVVSDASGNKSVAYALGRAVDQLPPTVTITAPAEVNQGDAFQFSVEVQDNYKIKHVSVKVDDDTIFDSDMDSNYWSKDFTYTFSHASPHSITVLAQDYYSNDASGTHPIEVHPVDENAPVIDLNAWYDANTAYILWRIHVTDPNLAEVNYYLNGQYLGSCDVIDGVADCGGGHDVNAPGTYVVGVVAVDSYGNRAERSVSVSVMDQPPVIHVANMTAPVGKEVNIPVSVYDDFGLSYVEVNGYGVHYGASVSGRSFVYAFPVTYTEEGNYTYVVRARDSGGNVAEANFVIMASRAGHTYELILSKQNGAPAKVWAEGKVDGAFVDLPCGAAVVHVVRTDDRTALAQYDLKTVQRNGHTACEVDVTGAGYYEVTVSWQGVQKSIGVRAFKGVSSAPENPVVAVGVAIVLLAIAARFI